ncbi:hypothetical protein JCM10213_008167 [Rhodosporidiobolus nylandii]
MPLPVLPADVHPLILGQLVTPTTAAVSWQPLYYKYLRMACLVSKDWARIAQKLLWEQVAFNRGDKQIQKWLEVSKPEFEVKALTFYGQPYRFYNVPSGFNWSAETALELFSRCGQITHFGCSFSLGELFIVAPDFPRLRQIEFLHPYRPSSLAVPLPPLTSMSLMGNTPQDDVCRLLCDDASNGRLSHLSHFNPHCAGHLKQLLPLAPLLRSLTFPIHEAYLTRVSREMLLQNCANMPLPAAVKIFLANAVNLERLEVVIFWSAELLHHLPSSLVRLDVWLVTPAILTLLTTHLSEHAVPVSLKEVHLRGKDGDWEVGQLYEATTRLRQVCEGRGIWLDV